MLRPKLLLIVATICLTQLAQASGAEQKIPQPGVKEVQVPFSSLKPSAMFKIGKTADWVLVTDDAVWVGGSKPYSVQRIDPSTNKIVAKIRLSGEACSGLAFGFGSLWVPVCGRSPSLARVDVKTNKISAILPFGTAGAEAGITASSDSIWIVPDEKSTLTRIDPQSNAVRQRIFEASVSDVGERFSVDSEPRRRNGESRRYEHKESNSYARRRNLLRCRFSLDSQIRHTAHSNRRENEHGLTPVGRSRWRCPALRTRLNLADGLSSWVALPVSS